MTTVLIASADQSLVFQLRSALNEMDGVRAEHVVDSTDELTSAVLRLDPDVVLVHDELGPDPALQVVRDLSMRRPTCSAVIVSHAASTDVVTAAMEAGARGLVLAPVAFEDLRSRVEAAGATAANMRRLMASSAVPDGAGHGRARVVTLVGAKGGVGTTTIATHMAFDLVRSVPGQRVCLVDLDLEKGDVAALIEVRHRASIADVAKVSDDLSARAVNDAVVVHESGLHLLLTPDDVRDVEAVTPRALREVVAVLRQEYDLVIVDAGSHVTPIQATAVELADEVVMVTTPDVLSLRALRRSIALWEGLAVRKESDVRVLVNRVSRQTSVSGETVRQLTRAPVMTVGIPAMFRRLEPGLNARDPYAVRERAWWRSLRLVVSELGLLRSSGARQSALQPVRSTPPDGSAVAGAGPVRRRRGKRGDAGSVSIETVGALPVALLIAVLCWQVALYGMSAVWAGHASSAAARALSVGADPVAAMRATLPDGVAGAVTVSGTGSQVTAVVQVPLLVPGMGSLPAKVTSSRAVVLEP